MAVLKEIVPGFTTWSEFNEEKQLNFNGYYIDHQGESVIVDPPGVECRGNGRTGIPGEPQ